MKRKKDFQLVKEMICQDVDSDLKELIVKPTSTSTHYQ